MDKALYQIEQAVKRAKSTNGQIGEDETVVDRLHKLLSSAGGSDGSPNKSSQTQHSDEYDSSSENSDVPTVPRHVVNDRDAIESAESPLQLLASAHRGSRRRRNIIAGSSGSHQLRAFFSPVQATLDVGEDVDPIELGLVTEEEAESLFELYTVLQLLASEHC